MVFASVAAQGTEAHYCTTEIAAQDLGATQNPDPDIGSATVSDR